MIQHWADTSFVLHGNAAGGNIAISPLTLSELEHIKTHERNEDLKFLARNALRQIVDGNVFTPMLVNNKKIDKAL